MIRNRKLQYLIVLLFASSILIYFICSRNEVIEIYDTDLNIKFAMPKVWHKNDLDGEFRGKRNIWLILSNGYLGLPASSSLIFYWVDDNRNAEKWVEDFVALKRNRLILSVENTFIGNANVPAKRFTYCDRNNEICEIYLIETDYGVFLIDVRTIRNSKSKEETIKNIFDSMEFSVR